MIHRLITLVILIPVAVILIALAAANRTPTPFTVDPFDPGNPALTMILPLFVWLFAALATGIVVGSFATWLRQGRYRRAARENSRRIAAIRSGQDGAKAEGSGTANLPARS